MSTLKNLAHNTRIAGLRRDRIVETIEPTMTVKTGIVQTAIESKLAQYLNPHHLEVHNESHMHSVPPNSETHFKVIIVSDVFNGKRKVARHQHIYGLLKDELEGPVHALALHLFTPEEWLENNTVKASPTCHGGSKTDS